MELESLNAVVVDLETTGLHTRTDRIIEIGALKIREGKVTDTYSQLFRPGFPLSEKVRQITGISDEMLEKGLVFGETAEELLSFLGDDVLIGHSITGDYAFLKKAFTDVMPKGFAFERNGIDTLKLSRRFLPQDEKKTLSQACLHYGYRFSAHRALSDAEATWFLLQRLYEEFKEADPEAFRPKPLRFAVKRDTPVMEKQLRLLERLLEEQGIQTDIELRSLTKSQASRMIDRIRAGERKELL